MDLEKGTRLILLGKTGVGKSEIANALTGSNVFKSGRSSKSTTHHVQKEEVIIGDNKIEVYDTPGVFHTEENNNAVRQKLYNLIQEGKSSNTIFLVVFKPERFTGEDRETVEFIQSILGNDLQQKTWIIFSHGDKLEEDDIKIDAIIKNSPPLRVFVEKCEKRIHVFNTQKKTAVHGLLLKLKEWKEKLSAQIQMSFGSHGSTKSTTEALTERRILLLGKTGVGKSATGNTILGANVFKTERSLNSVTQTCKVQKAVFEDKTLCVTDTPGFFDTELTDEEFAVEMGRSFFDCPGPHAFLYIVPLNTRFTEQDMGVTENIKDLYGESVLKHTIVVFTFGDKFKKNDIPKLIKRNRFLREILQQCNERYIVYNNNDKGSKSQVRKLVSMIDHMVAENKEHYSSELFEEARKAQAEKLVNGKDMTELIEKLKNAPNDEKESIIHQLEAINQANEKHAREKIKKEFGRADSLRDANTNYRDPENQEDLQMPRDSQAELQTGCQEKPGINQVQESEAQPVVNNNNAGVEGVHPVLEDEVCTSEQQSNSQSDAWYKKLLNRFQSTRFWKFLQTICQKICRLVRSVRCKMPRCPTVNIPMQMRA